MSNIFEHMQKREDIDGGPAFPSVVTDTDGGKVNLWGMSLRDWLAGMALQGILASGEVGGLAHDVAAVSYKYADAVIEARKK